MNLKEAFRYQNFLDRLLSYTGSYLDNPANVTKTAQEHMRQKANKEAEDETGELDLKVINRIIEIVRDGRVKHDVKDVVSFILALLDEKSRLCDSISSAKAESGKDIDALIAMNKAKQAVSCTLSNMSDIRPTERITRGSGYKFNAEGNQVQYVYDVKEVTTIDFDRNDVKKLRTRLKNEADDVSTLVDQLMVNLQVAIEPLFDVNDSFEDSLDRFITAQ